MKFRHIVILILILLSLFLSTLIDGELYELTFGYLFFVVPIEICLFFVSFLSQKKDIGLQKKLAKLGIMIAILVFVILGSVTVYRHYERYYDMAHGIQY